MRLTALDLETLDTDINNSIIYDVAVVSVDVEFIGKKCIPEITNPNVVTFRFNMLEKMRFGRTASADTINFHINRMKSGESDIEKFEEFHLKLNDQQLASEVMAVKGLSLIREACKSADEIWINGLSFDCSLLASLKKQSGYELDLWKYIKERDVRSINRSIPTLSQKTTVMHEAFDDAQWNLQVAIAYHKLIQQHKLSLELPMFNIDQTVDGTWVITK
jgi:hypothetical protein